MENSLRGPDGVSRDTVQDLFCLRDTGLATEFGEIRDSNRVNVIRKTG